MDRTKPNPLLGLQLGLLTACGLTAIAGALFMVDGPTRFEDISLGVAIAIYFVAGTLGGPLFGLALPLTVHRSGASLVGGAIALAVYVPISRLVPAAATGWVGAAVVGAVVGFVIWKPVPIERGEGGSPEAAP